MKGWNLGALSDPRCIYIAEHLYCEFESSFSIISTHASLAGAYKAMQRHKWNAWTTEREIDLEHGHDRSWGPIDYCVGERWRIRKVELKD